MIPSLVRAAPLLVLLFLAAVSDLRTRKIPNWVTLLLIISGLVHSASSVGSGIGLSVAGLFAAAALPLVQYAIGTMGAGDVKLMAGVGAWLGPFGGVTIYLLATLVGMTIAICHAAAEGTLPLLFRNSALIALNLIHIRHLDPAHVLSTGQSVKSVGRPLPFAVPVLIAAALVVALGGHFLRGL